MPELDLSGFLDDDTWKIGGVAGEDGALHSYAIPSPNGRDGLLLQRMYQYAMQHGGRIDGEAGEDMVRYCTRPDGTLETFDEKLLGPVYQQMLDHGVSAVRIVRVAEMAFMNFGLNEDAVKITIENEGKAVALANRAERRAAAKKRPSSPRKAGPKLAPASGAKNTPASKASTSGPGTSERPARKTA